MLCALLAMISYFFSYTLPIYFVGKNIKIGSYYSHHKKIITEGIDVLTNLSMVIISQNICIKSYIAHLKLIQCYVSIMAIQLKKIRSS